MGLEVTAMSDDMSAKSLPQAASAVSAQMVLGWDLQPNSSAAVRFAVSLAQRLDAHLHVVHVADVDDLPIDPDAWDWEEQLDQRLAENATTARALLDQLHANWTYHAFRGRPGDVIADLAEQTDALMIILGAPRGGMLSFIETLAGVSVSHQLTRQHGRPVLIVPESHTSEEVQR
jgi:nucleotide-binding universal stress UspA family protein